MGHKVNRQVPMSRPTENPLVCCEMRRTGEGSLSPVPPCYSSSTSLKILSAFTPGASTPDDVLANNACGVGLRCTRIRATVFPDLLPASHICLAVDECRCIAAHDCPDAGTFIDTDRSQACAGSGPEPSRCDEETGSAEKIGDYQSRSC